MKTLKESDKKFNPESESEESAGRSREEEEEEEEKRPCYNILP